MTSDYGFWTSILAIRREGVHSMIMLTSWEIWKERNNRVFNQRCNSAVQVFQAIHEEAKVWIRAGNKGLP